VLVLRNRIGDDNLVDGRSFDTVDGIAAKHAVRDERINGGRALLLEQLGRTRDSVARVDQVVDQDAHAARDVADQHHAGILPVRDLGRAALLCEEQWVLVSLYGGQRGRAHLVDQSKVDAHAVGDGRRALGAARVGADDDGILVVGDVCLNVPLQQRPAVQVVDGDVEEALD